MSRRPRRRRGRARALPPFFRRRSTMWLIAAIVTLSVGLTLGAISRLIDGGGDGNTVAVTPGATAATTSRTPTSAFTAPPAVELPDIRPDPVLLERAEVLDVIDGDTIDVRVDGREERVRYYGVDTPERGDDCFDASTDRNEALLGDTVLLLPDARERDRFGRLLRYAFDAGGTSIEAQLIAEGLGSAWRQDGAYRDRLIALETSAEQAGLGCLWD